MNEPAFLILKNGDIFIGKSIGVQGITIGEIVFNTAITGYQEILTDPSYKNQIVTFTYPHIGNVGINIIDQESNCIQVNGIIIRDLSCIHSNYRSSDNLGQYLKNNKIIGITEIDTRKLTRILRDQGSQYGCIFSHKHSNIDIAKKYFNTEIKKTQNHLVDSISTKKKYSWKNEKNHILNNVFKTKNKKIGLKIAVYDFGTKNNILRILFNYGCSVIVVPANTCIKQISLMNVDGIILSNGPGDPRIYIDIINNITKLIKTNIPILGICLGHQLLALSNNAKITKMPFGHHGSNHPIQNIKNKKIFITTQNHNFVVDKKVLPKNIKITYISLFDYTIQGIKIKNKNIWGFQGHPESNPGPQDLEFIFHKFIKNIKKIKNLHRIKNAKTY